MTRLMLLQAPDKEKVLEAMRVGNAPFSEGVEVYDDQLGRNVVRSHAMWGSQEIVVARYEVDGIPIDVWSNLFKTKIEDSEPESYACFAMYDCHVDLYIRPLYDLGLIIPLNNDKEADPIINDEGVTVGDKDRLWVKDNKNPYKDISAEDKETIQRISNMLPHEVEIDGEMVLIDQMPPVTGV